MQINQRHLLKIRFLWIFPAFAFLLNVSSCLGQNRLPDFRLDTLFQKPDLCTEISFSFEWVNPIGHPWTRTFPVCSEMGDTLLLQVSNSSQLLLAKKDKESLRYLPLEKNSFFPFCQLESKTRYKIQLVRSAFPHGYLMARLLLPNGNVLDEVFYCFSVPPKSLDFCQNKTE